VLIGAAPPAAISDWRYLGVSLLAGLVTFFWYPDIDKTSQAGVVIRRARDSACLPSPAHKKALIAGTQSGDGDFYGSANRDWWWNTARCARQPKRPTVLQADIYAVAALAAGVVVVIGYVLHYPTFSNDDRGRTPLLLAASLWRYIEDGIYPSHGGRISRIESSLAT